MEDDGQFRKRIVIFLARQTKAEEGGKILDILRCTGASTTSSFKGTDCNRLSLQSLSPQLKTWLKDHPASSSIFQDVSHTDSAANTHKCIPRFVTCTKVDEHPSLSSHLWEGRQPGLSRAQSAKKSWEENAIVGACHISSLEIQIQVKIQIQIQPGLSRAQPAKKLWYRKKHK